MNMNTYGGALKRLCLDMKMLIAAHLLHATAVNVCHAFAQQFDTGACTPFTHAVTSLIHGVHVELLDLRNCNTLLATNFALEKKTSCHAVINL